MKYLMLLLLSVNVFASASKEVFIKGKISGDFDEKRVKVTDHLGQTYYLPRKVFPKDQVIKQGQAFAFEVHEKELANLKLLKK